MVCWWNDMKRVLSQILTSDNKPWGPRGLAYKSIVKNMLRVLWCHQVISTLLSLPLWELHLQYLLALWFIHQHGWITGMASHFNWSMKTKYGGTNYDERKTKLGWKLIVWYVKLAILVDMLYWDDNKSRPMETLTILQHKILGNVSAFIKSVSGNLNWPQFKGRFRALVTIIRHWKGVASGIFNMLTIKS